MEDEKYKRAKNKLPGPSWIPTSPPVKGSTGGAASERQLISTQAHNTQAMLSSLCYHWEKKYRDL